MAYCPDCGDEVEGGHTYCQSCGSNLSATADSQLHQEEPTSSDGEISPTSISEDNTEQQSFTQKLTRQEKIVFVGSGLTVIGAFLPWATVFGTSISGIQGDGILTLLFGLVASGLVWWRPSSRKVQGAVIGLGVLIILISLSAMTRVAGIGLYLTLVGGLVLSVAGTHSILNT